MSHFSVIVATELHPIEAVLSEQMQPFHEFECTGTDDEFVKEIDITEEVRQEYATSTERRYLDPNGKSHCPYVEEFYRDPTCEEASEIGPISGTGGNGKFSWSSRDWKDGRGYRAKIHFLPDGWSERDVPKSDVMSVVEFASEWHDKDAVVGESNIDIKGDHKYGYSLVSEGGELIRVVKRTNPNSHWDYWRVGGRYARKFQGKSGLAEPLSWEWRDESEKPTGFDQIQKCNLDFSSMKATAVTGRQKTVAEWLQKSGLTTDEFEQGCKQKSRLDTLFQSQIPRLDRQEFKLLAEGNGLSLGWKVSNVCWGDTPDITTTLADWISAAPALTSFAFVRDKKWAQRGDMGWFGCVRNEMSMGEWLESLSNLIADVPDSWWLSVVDCHI